MSRQKEEVGKAERLELRIEARQKVKVDQPSVRESSFHADELPSCVSSSDTVSRVGVTNNLKAVIFSTSRKPVTSKTSQTLSNPHQQSFSTQAGLGNMEDLTSRTGKTSLQDSAVSTETSNPPLATDTTTAPPAQNPNQSEPQQKKEKKAKAPKQASAPTALPLSPALIDLRVGHILRCLPHENADSLYVSTIAMGDPEGTENTQKDEESGRIVRTVCSGLRGLIPLEEMQDRKVIVMANLKPVTMRGIKSTAMVLAASAPPKEGEDTHAAGRVVELVAPPEGSDGGDKVYFEGWEYGEGKGPEKVLNPKKKQWEGVQPGLYTTEDLTVMFDAGRVQGVAGGTGELVIEGGKGKCKVPSLKGARLS